jgi:hypothetical protein
MSTALQFCGRESKLAILAERWQRAADIDNPSPQVIVIKAEPGLGKTRLALEFYRWLSQQVDAQGPDGYWPDAPTIVGRNLHVNPEPSACNFNVTIPYLWWGLRVGDRGVENGVAGDAIATYDRFIAPHLVTLLIKSKMHGRAWSLGKAWLEVGVDITANLLQVDTILAVGKGVLESVRIIKGGFEENVRDASRRTIIERPLSRSEAILKDFEKIFNPKSGSYARTPGVILIDDAQFAQDDPALPVFIERLMHSAVTQNWPVMIIVTHWRREFLRAWQSGKEFSLCERASFAEIVRHGLEGSRTEKGPSAKPPGGFLNEENYCELDLEMIDDLSPALMERLPGLSAGQFRAILRRVDGNPRFFEQIIAFLEENEEFFENCDLRFPLTENGLVETLKATPDILSVAQRRLREAPEEIQEAICLASVQGAQFATSIVCDMGKMALGRKLEESLGRAKDPYSMLTGFSSANRGEIGFFSERLFFEAASKRRKSLKSLGGELALQRALREFLSERLDDPHLEEHLTPEQCQMLLALAAKVLGASTIPGDSEKAKKALMKLINFEKARGSIEAAEDAERTLYKIVGKPQSPEFAKCWIAAGRHLSKFGKEMGIVWLKADLHPPLMEHLSFRLGNQIFFVRLEDVEQELGVPGTVMGLLATAKEWNGHACIMPMRRQDDAWAPHFEDWGLLDARTLEPKVPPAEITGELIEMTDWELYDFAVQVVRSYIKDTLGREVTGWANNPHLDPAIWFRGEKGLEWVVVRAVRYPEKNAPRPHNLTLIAAACAKELNPIGHFASVAVAAADDTFAPDQIPTPLWRGRGISVSFPGLEPIEPPMSGAAASERGGQ